MVIIKCNEHICRKTPWLSSYKYENHCTAVIYAIHAGIQLLAKGENSNRAKYNNGKDNLKKLRHHVLQAHNTQVKRFVVLGCYGAQPFTFLQQYVVFITRNHCEKQSQTCDTILHLPLNCLPQLVLWAAENPGIAYQCWAKFGEKPSFHI